MLRSTLLRIDGAFLVFVGVVQVPIELASHYFGIGPYGEHFVGSPDTIGFVEAHGLALLIGLLLLGVAALAPTRAWHLFAAGVHLLLGGANVLFWGSFVALGLTPMGAIATVIHALLIGAHLTVLAAACAAASPPVPDR
jgi:hypothetical protein